MGLVQRLYEKKLLGSIRRCAVPHHVVLVLDELDVLLWNNTSKIKYFAKWCVEVDIRILTVFIGLIEEEAGQRIGRQLAVALREELREVTDNIRLYCRDGSEEDISPVCDGFCINLAIGYSGRFELTKALRRIMERVERGELSPEDINEGVIEEHLCIRCEPDLVIRSGGKRLTDFLIWQSAYSEFYFTDVNWQEYRRVDFLRAIRDYQKRQRRFGR